MSSTNRGSQRDLDDHYATPPDVAKLICKTLRDDGHITDPDILLEPGCGEGSFLDAFAEIWPDAVRIGVDLNPNLVEISKDRGHLQTHVCDYLSAQGRASVAQKIGFGDGLPLCGGIVGNPPFSRATEFIRTSLGLLEEGGCLAMLQRLNFLGTLKRYSNFWRDPTVVDRFAHLYVLPCRLGFTPDGGQDSIEYGMYVWKEDHDGSAPTLSFIDNRRIENKWKGQAWLWRRERGEA